MVGCWGDGMMGWWGDGMTVACGELRAAAGQPSGGEQGLVCSEAVILLAVLQLFPYVA